MLLWNLGKIFNYSSAKLYASINLSLNMTKDIKFDLHSDNHPCRTIKDLQEHFCAEDILDSYQNGKLVRWLEVRGYNDYLEKVKKIEKGKSSKEIVSELALIFEMGNDMNKINQDLFFMDYEMENEKRLNNLIRRDEIIKDYHKYYLDLIDNIVQLAEEYEKYNTCDFTKDVIREHINFEKNFKRDNDFNDPEFYESKVGISKDSLEKAQNAFANIKAILRAIIKDYKRLFDLDYRHFFWSMIDHPIVIVCLLMNDESRIKYIQKEDDAGKKENLSKNKDQAEICEFLELHIYEDYFLKKLTPCLRTCRNIEPGWHDLENKNKYMVLRLPDEAAVKPIGKRGTKLLGSDINGEFKIINGLSYLYNESYNDHEPLYYIEV